MNKFISIILIFIFILITSCSKELYEKDIIVEKNLTSQFMEAYKEDVHDLQKFSLFL